MFGRLIFGLCCANPAAMNTLPKALDTMTRLYSADVKTLGLYLISKPAPHKAGDYFEGKPKSDVGRRTLGRCLI